jgi:predicted nucleotidyltransferase
MSSSSNAAVDSTAAAREMPRVALSLAEWEIVSELLRRLLPGREVWAYGSRARGSRLKKFSDLDLAIEGPPLSLAARSDLAEAFDQSDLPFKVDFVEVESLAAEFRQKIEADKVVLSSST